MTSKAFYLSSKVYKTISDSMKDRKIMNCIVLSIILKYLIYIIKLGWVLCMRKIFNKSINFVLKILCCTMFYSDSE